MGIAVLGATFIALSTLNTALFSGELLLALVLAIILVAAMTLTGRLHVSPSKSGR
ncbi:hypothetical protein JQ607_26990 [Bradyrhizobium liaoningense]|uniref:hypothetical protein n=1 Tax=Bradyrhizobium liaoningense TaxID=43992 RepID=UPI001BA87A7A|nr:hypothetical protein [Bradyrhizobium liaoningense]MBR0843857.1 hypothetical protein [Bradyrhizobium liaoningense]